MEYSTSGFFEINTNSILERISEQDIFKYYIKGYDRTTKKFCSELRSDKNPTCSIKQMVSGRFIYKDFGTSDCYTCFDYIQAKYGLDFYSSLKLIANDMGLIDNNGFGRPVKPIITNTKSIIDSKTDIRIVPIKYTIKGLNYWFDYGINEDLLSRYKIKQISHYYINNNLITIKKNEIAFAYCFGNYKYKILRPSDKNWKWITNCNSNILQGYEQLPDKAELLLLTSSLKDVLSLRSIGYFSVSSQSENTTIPEKFIVEFKKRFSKVILFLNNDLAGLRAAEYQSKLYNVPYMYFPICMPKDPSDFIKSKGVEETSKMIAKIISNIR